MIKFTVHTSEIKNFNHKIGQIVLYQKEKNHEQMKYETHNVLIYVCILFINSGKKCII